MDDIDDLGTVIDESTVLAARVDETRRFLGLHLGIRAHPAAGASAMPEVIIEFGGLSRLACRVQKGESYEDPTPEQSWRMGWRELGPPNLVPDVDALNDWLDRFRGELYGQANPMFDRADPVWLATASLDRTWEPAATHTVDLSFDTTPTVRDHTMDLRAWFERIAVFDSQGHVLEAGVVVEQVRAWWNDFKSGRTHGQHGYVPASQ